MDTLANTVFGMETDMQSQPKNKFFIKAHELLNSGVDYAPFILINCKI
jgi:hypothetical protein